MLGSLGSLGSLEIVSVSAFSLPLISSLTINLTSRFTTNL